METLTGRRVRPPVVQEGATTLAPYDADPGWPGMLTPSSEAAAPAPSSASSSTRSGGSSSSRPTVYDLLVQHGQARYHNYWVHIKFEIQSQSLGP